MPTQDYSQHVNNGFNLLRKGLRPFVEDQMRATYPNHWLDKCRAVPSVKLERDGSPKLDNQALLHIMRVYWEEVFMMDKRRGPKQRGYISSLIAWRNDWEGHQTGDIPKHDALDFLEIVVSTLKSIDAKEQTEEAEQLLQSLQPTPLPQSILPVLPTPPIAQAKPLQEQLSESEITDLPKPVSPTGTAVIANESEHLHTGRTTDFWGAYHFDFADALNEEIWQHSPVVQQEIQPSDTLKQPGVIGAQQAMLNGPLPDGRDSLPWVPDLVGNDWRDASSVVVVGSAYAGFIREYSTRTATIPMNQYATSSVEDFQSLFLRYVVRPDPNYYGPLQNLCSKLGSAARLSLVDLCRVSLVKRGSGTVKRMDASTGIARESPAIYEKYVESEQPSEWLWRRFAEGQARCVLALGSTCEHGLLRLFSRRGMTITQDGEPFFVPPIAQGAWVNEYADPNRKLSYWLNHETWWTIQGQVDGTERIWHVLPVYHPASHQNYDPSYQRTKNVFRQMQDAHVG